MDTTATTTTIPPTMTALTHTSAGTPLSVFSLSTAVPTPALTTPTSILIRTSHTSLNIGPTIMASFAPFFLRTSPGIPEMDFSGTIIAVGSLISTSSPRSDELLPGTPVFGSIPVAGLMAGRGAMAEYIVVESEHVAPVPSGMGMAEAAGLGIAGMTSLTLMRSATDTKVGGLTRGGKVLVNGASGGIGTLIVQMCKKVVGAEGRVVGICSARNRELVGSLGADSVVDYNLDAGLLRTLGELYGGADGSPEEKFDVVIDCRGVQSLYTSAGSFLKPGKPFISVGPKFSKLTLPSMLYTVVLMGKNSLVAPLLPGSRKWVQVASFVSLEELKRLKEVCEEDGVRVVLHEGRVFDLWKGEEWREAYQVLMEGRARGKVVVKVQKD